MTITHDALDLNIQTPLVLWFPLDIRHGNPPPLTPTWDNLALAPPLLVLTSGGQSTYALQASSTHPTEMLSCYFLV